MSQEASISFLCLSAELNSVLILCSDMLCKNVKVFVVVGGLHKMMAGRREDKARGKRAFASRFASFNLPPESHHPPSIFTTSIPHDMNSVVL